MRFPRSPSTSRTQPLPGDPAQVGTPRNSDAALGATTYGRGVHKDLFDDPRLAVAYDAVEADRSDLDAYLSIVDEFGAGSVLDVGCGTGTFALLLAKRDIDVIAVDPAGASIDLARTKPGADRVRWLHGYATSLPPLKVDVATMTANVAQAIAAESDWLATLTGVRAALRAGGRLVFETRDPAKRAWERWNREHTYQVIDVPGYGSAQRWEDLLEADGPLVTFRTTHVFDADGTTVTSTSTLRFRTSSEVVDSLLACGYQVDDVRDAPDRPGREFVFIARPPE